jgi:hypothetical protein
MPDRFRCLLSCPSRLSDHKLGPDLAMNRGDYFLFKEGSGKVEEDFDSGGAQNFHGLPNGGERRIVDGRREMPLRGSTC